VFKEEVLLSILVGTFQYNPPVFSLKFSLMILKKILPILKNLDLIEDLGTFLFTPFEY